MSSGRWLSVAIAVVALGASSIALWAATARDRPDTAESEELQRTAQGWSKLVEHGEREESTLPLGQWPFSYFVTVPHGMPEGLRKEVAQILGDPRPLRLRFDDARVASVAAATRLWAVPGASVICMFRVPQLAAACRTRRQAYLRGISLQTYKLSESAPDHPVSFSVLGIAPDGMAAVPAKIGKQRIEIPVARNVYSHTAKQPIAITPAKS